ncbi:Serine aminopeptidase, S33 [Saccharopolyspora kobensis]|uniref:Serine aminopeptidase, S33 n=1 Tax=Saccharopolyspora kobensis TaxID=146035 RepID=A0A1H5SSF7_9PSEU|nr:alpha/beta hydrolase [Saccharopolyspora kobensis]SEF53552.1 Serine aminopeptidase, S33 [Saccharopolyspora kobensis]SFC53870.1 Serine aminopeptidase, S33 [Saccharopolyspora kobensis]
MNRLALTTLLTALLVAGCSAGTSPEPARGTLTSSAPLEHERLPSAQSEWLITYTSEGARGEPVTVSGTVSVPASPPPQQGWPVISWAHGTTGTADVCAPSADRPGGPAHGYVGLADQTLDRWVAAGYAVVQTDYEGLGTPGEHPYLNGRSAANAVADIVRAARQVSPGIGSAWFAMGHSQGGHAALHTAAADQHDLSLRGAVAIAPGGFQSSRTTAYFQQQTDERSVRAALPFLPTLLIGAAAVDPGIVPEDLLDEQARPVLDAARRTCQDGVREAAATIDADRVFRDGADLGGLTAYLKSQEPEGLALRVPTLVLQGSADALVSEPGTASLVEALCARSPAIGYQVFDGADHRRVLAASQPAAQRFTETLLAGGRPQSACPRP